MVDESGERPERAVVGFVGRPRMLDRVHEAVRRRHFSRRTKETWVHWIKCFIHFHGKRHPETLGEPEVAAFINHLAAGRNVAASTQVAALAQPRRTEQPRAEYPV